MLNRDQIVADIEQYERNRVAEVEQIRKSQGNVHAYEGAVLALKRVLSLMDEADAAVAKEELQQPPAEAGK